MTERTLGREQAIYRVTWIGFAVNLVLSAGKLCRRYLGTQRGHGGRRHPFGVGLRHRSGGAALRARFGQTARRRPRLRPREIRNAGHAHHRCSACRCRNQAVVERRHSDPRLHARPPSDTAGRRGAVGGRCIDRRQRSTLSLHGARRPKGQQPLGRGQRMASPQRRALIGRHARRNRLRLFPWAAAGGWQTPRRRSSWRC